MENNVVTCVYCGHEYPDGTPKAKHELLTAHIAKCDNHPMRAAEDKIRVLRSALAALIGDINPDSFDELGEMEAAVRMTPGPESDKRVALNAIVALRQTIPQ